MVIDAVQGGDGPTVLQHIPTELRANRAVVLAAVEANGHSIQYGNKAFYDDEDIVMAASFDFPALTLASRRIQDNRAFIHDVCLRCRAGMVGPNLMSFLEDTALLTEIAASLPPGHHPVSHTPHVRQRRSDIVLDEDLRAGLASQLPRSPRSL